MARQHLYRNVQLRSYKQSRLLSRTLTESPAVSPLIQHLHYTNNSSASYVEEGSLQEEPPLTEAHAVSKLSSLRSATFNFRVLSALYLFPFARSFSVLDSLDSLCLQNAIARAYPDMAHLLWSFPSVRTVELDGCSWFFNTPIVDADAYPDRCRNLRDLKIRNPRNGRGVGCYLDLFASGVRSLLLWCDPEDDSDDGLRAYRHLETLDLGTLKSRAGWIVAALSHVRSDNIQHLSLRFYDLPLETVFRGWTESRLDETLSSAPFLGLKQLSITLFSNFTPENAQEEIARILPQCHARGILKFDVQSLRINK